MPPIEYCNISKKNTQDIFKITYHRRGCVSRTENVVPTFVRGIEQREKGKAKQTNKQSSLRCLGTHLAWHARTDTYDECSRYSSRTNRGGTEGQDTNQPESASPLPRHTQFAIPPQSNAAIYPTRFLKEHQNQVYYKREKRTETTVKKDPLYSEIQWGRQ